MEASIADLLEDIVSNGAIYVQQHFKDIEPAIKFGGSVLTASESTWTTFMEQLQVEPFMDVELEPYVYNHLRQHFCKTRNLAAFEMTLHGVENGAAYRRLYDEQDLIGLSELSDGFIDLSYL